jgi:hypothetical protein
LKYRTCIAVGDVDGASEGATEQDSDNSLARVPGDSVVVVDDAEQNQWVNDDLLDGLR